MARRILYLSYDGITDPLGQSQIVPYMVELSRKGYSIHIISFEKPERAAHLDSMRRLLTDNGIQWTPLRYTRRPPIVSTLYDLFRLSRAVKRVVKEHNPIIHCRSYLTAIVALKMKRRYGTPVIFDMRGFWPDERVEGGLWNLANPIYRAVYRYMKRQERMLLAGCSHIITLTHKSVPIIRNIGGVSFETPITVIPTCVETGHFNSDYGGLTVREELNLKPTTFVLGYVGSLGTWYLLDKMMELYHSIIELHEDSAFLIITTDAIGLVDNEISRLKLNPNNVLVRSATRDEIPKYIQACDWLTFFIRPVFSKSASMPTKFAEIAMCRKPVVCNSGVGDLQEIFDSGGLGLCLPKLDEESLRQAAATMVNNQRLVVDPSLVEMEFGLEEGVKRIDRIYDSLL